ncbi:hypothetical protein [Magnetofaba australis]|uniref:Circularly permuted ATPgrasp domain-containing protein n=1 Tax=Magnetofaba australis IT-1 TaxID=1434232 RepID=A0A1Y2K8F2_9PROT|nr:hypothetical protein [Magnetofaba australis]OSM06909.1 hypothetical protein MAIT1_00208 [Magnetofaba australis IT-1]
MNDASPSRPGLPHGVLDCQTPVSRQNVKRMAWLAKSLHGLLTLPAYRERVEPTIHPTAQFDPGHFSVMMGFDFHITDDGPRLIEVNTNAGGGLFAYQTTRPYVTGADFVGQYAPPTHHQKQLLDAFLTEWGLFARHNGVERPLRRLVIMDDNPTGQYLYPEMRAFERFFNHWDVAATVCAPEELEMDESGVRLNGEAVDFVYNRHCDFYFDTPAMAGLKAAYLAGRVCVSPNPRMYGMLADKRRLVGLSDPHWLMEIGLGEARARRLAELIPQVRALDSFTPEAFWEERKQWVLKPAASHGSRGVVLGTALRRNRFAETDPAETLVQRLAPPSQVQCDETAKPLKADFRLFAYQDRLLGAAARLYRGQVTNFKDPDSGYAAVTIA